ncbi:hypothetical protein GQX73_g4400 [Xylaria multiplex]|uniref:Uncharacterized protein n=1 Tax=Xylaria multiplex TaxID=323545 RepID=A0A7C8IR66_9PEZI|nr:hypothetical protein GQX73_g4400 [Xylaria multiplex]
MTKSLMKLLAIPALLAGAVQGLHFTNDIPVNSYYEVGTEFVLEWVPEARTDGFRLQLSSFLSEPIYVGPPTGPWTGPQYDYKSQTVDLDLAVPFAAGNYTWVVEPWDNRTGSGWFYSFAAYWDLGSASPRSFHLKPAE